jgi:hypothetical protein
MDRLLTAFVPVVMAGFVVVSAASPSQARPDVRSMTCSQVQALLAQEHAVTFTTGPNTYARYVGPGICDATRVARPTTISTKDTNQCAVNVCGPRVLERHNDN